MKSKLLLYLTILITLIWMVIIYSFSASPSEESNSKSKEIIRYVVEIVHKEKSKKEIELEVNKLNKPVRKIAHASVYFVLANFLNSLLCTIKKNKLKLCNIISVIICFIYACTDEFHQTFVTNRTGQISDVLIDTFGAIIGCLVFNFIYKKVKEYKRQDEKRQIHLREKD